MRCIICGLLMQFKCPACSITYCSHECANKNDHSTRCGAPLIESRVMITPDYLCHNMNCHSNVKCTLQCAKCYGIFYCSKTCQKADWSRHKPECNEFLYAYKYFQHNHPHIFMKHVYDINRYGIADKPIRIFTPIEYLKCSPEECERHYHSKPHVRDALEVGHSVYLFVDTAVQLRVISIVGAEINDVIMEKIAALPRPTILDQVD
jgi:hypothetical protein